METLNNTDFLAEWNAQKTALLAQQNKIIAASDKARQAANDLAYLIEERKKLLVKFEDASAESVLSGNDTAKPIQKKIDEMDKLIAQASAAAVKAESALSGLNRRLVATTEEIAAHDAKLPALWAEHLLDQGRKEVEQYAKLHDQLTESYGKIQAAGIWAARLNGSRHPRLEMEFRNRAPQEEPPRFSSEQGRFNVAEHSALLSLQTVLNRAGVDTTLPSGLY